MKRIILFALCMGLLTSCVDHYAAKDKDGAPILIIDEGGVISDADDLSLDSIYVRKSNNDDHFEPLRRMGESETIFWSDTTANGEKYHGITIYRIIYTSDVIYKCFCVK